ncbi:hypothetical protein [Nostoc sp.]
MNRVSYFNRTVLQVIQESNRIAIYDNTVNCLTFLIQMNHYTPNAQFV